MTETTEIAHLERMLETKEDILADALADPLADLAEFDLCLSKKRKKKKKELKDALEPSLEEADYTYMELLERLKSRQREQFHSHSKNENEEKLILPQILLDKLGSKRMRWNNFRETATKLKRPQDHLHAFIEAEMGCVSSVDSKGALVIVGKTDRDKITKLRRKYVRDFVLCGQCKGSDSVLLKDKTTRLMFLDCKGCGSRTSTPPIHKMFRAKTRADRKKERE